MPPETSIPIVTFLGEDLSTQARTGTNVQQEARSRQLFVFRARRPVDVRAKSRQRLHSEQRERGNGQVEEFEAAVGHFGLDRLHSRVARVLLRLARIVEL